MPKMKTKRAVAKRFTKTANGKLKFQKSGLRHILTKHSKKTKRKLRKAGFVHGTDYGRISRCLPYA
jgi:large subunit ribosomal protein L35